MLKLGHGTEKRRRNGVQSVNCPVGRGMLRRVAQRANAAKRDPKQNNYFAQKTASANWQRWHQIGVQKHVAGRCD